MMFRGLAFNLAPTLSSEEKAELKQLIRQNGGVVSDTTKGATELVTYDKLDACHANRISTDFIKDSVAFRTLQDPAKYSGKIFTTKLKQRISQRRGEKVQYTLEDDARMLLFARTNCKATGSVPLSAWEIAERDKVTLHSSQSMREHFRKQLTAKTPVEQRIILAKAAATTRARLLKQEDETEDEEEQEVQVQEPSPRARSRPTLTGFSTVEATATTGPPRSAVPVIEAPVKEVERQRSNRRRTRSRKQTTPLQISQRIQASGGDSDQDITSSVPSSESQPSYVTRLELAVDATIATPKTPASPSTSAVSTRLTPRTPGDQSKEKQQQKRKRDTPPSGISSQESRSSLQESDADCEGSETSGIYFTSAWTTTVNDRSKRRLLQQFFEPPSRAESISSEQIEDASIAAHEEDGSNEPLQTRVIEATEEETDTIICQLQIATHQDLKSVVHALYYFNGDVEKAKQFLKGAPPSDLWYPEDDLLLTNLVVEEGTDLSSVDEALARGDFVSLQEPRDSDAILERVKFLK